MGIKFLYDASCTKNRRRRYQAVCGGVRDSQGIGRIKYIDAEEKNPSNVLYASDRPSLDIGNPGCFDDNGVILGDIIPVNNLVFSDKLEGHNYAMVKKRTYLRSK